jgi:hypothetical protein
LVVKGKKRKELRTFVAKTVYWKKQTMADTLCTAFLQQVEASACVYAMTTII